MASGPLQRILRQLSGFVAFVYSRFPLSRVALALTLCATGIEYLTFSLMLPLSGQAGGGRASAFIHDTWNQAAAALSVTPGPQVWLWIFLFLLAFRTIMAFLLVWTNTVLSKQVHAHLSNNLFGQVVEHEPLAEIYRRSIGHYISVAGDDTSKAGNIILYFGQAVASLLDAAVGLFLLFAFSKPVFFATLLFVLLSSAFVLVLLRRVLALNQASALQSRALNTYFVDALNGIRSLRSMAAETYVVTSYSALIRRYLRSLVSMELLKQAMKSGPALLLIVMGIAWAWPGSSLSNQTREPVYFVALTMLLVRVLVAMGSVVTRGERLFSDMRAAHDIDELISTRAPGLSAPHLAPGHAPISSIVLSSVTAHYRAGTDILKEVSGEFRAKHSYALIGESGSGKSTLADLILALLPVESGEIFFNGQSLATLSRGQLRRRVLLVEQQTRIFTGTLRENILLGFDATEAQLQSALASADLSSFVSLAPAGLEHWLDYQGANLSGGQRQRVGIARALVRSPEVLILDEATSALDPNVRDHVIDHVRKQMAGGILILITHDPTIASLVDEVWRVHNGSVDVVSRSSDV